MNRKLGWFMFSSMWMLLVYGIFTHEWVRVAMAGACLPFSVVLLWEGSKYED